MRRRDFMGLLGGTVALWPLAVTAHPPSRIARIGYLSPVSQSPIDNDLRAGLLDLGYVEGKNLVIEARFADGHADRLAGLTAELVDLKVEVIVSFANGVYAAAGVTNTVPIVMGTASDVVAMGLVASLAHPGGNITGQTFLVPELVAKRLEFLAQIAPSMTRAGILLMRDSRSNANLLAVLGPAAEALKVELRPILIADASDLESAIFDEAGDKIGGLVSTDQSLFIAKAATIAAIAQKRGVPSVGGPFFAVNGGLMGYGVDFSPMMRHAAVFVDKILNGERPGDIPIEQATKFQTLVNLITAKALGIEMPPMILARADKVIE